MLWCTLMCFRSDSVGPCQCSSLCLGTFAELIFRGGSESFCWGSRGVLKCASPLTLKARPIYWSWLHHASSPFRSLFFALLRWSFQVLQDPAHCPECGLVWTYPSFWERISCWECEPGRWRFEVERFQLGLCLRIASSSLPFLVAEAGWTLSLESSEPTVMLHQLRSPWGISYLQSAFALQNQSKQGLPFHSS